MAHNSISSEMCNDDNDDEQNRQLNSNSNTYKNTNTHESIVHSNYDMGNMDKDNGTSSSKQSCKRKRKLDRLTPTQRGIHQLQKDIINCYKDLDLTGAMDLYRRGKLEQNILPGVEVLNSMISFAAGLGPIGVCDMVWCDVMWCDLIWCDVVWCGVV